MKQHKKYISLSLALLLCVGLFMAGAMPASAAEGTCGENLTWNLQNGVLTISGSGAMPNFTDKTTAPWLEYADQIQCVRIADGITSIGDLAFYHCANLTSVTLPSSVKSVGQLAFAGCYNMMQISFPGVESIGWGCFYDCTAITTISLPDSLRVIEDKAFYHCSSLAGITIPESVESFGNSVFCYNENLVYVKIKCQISILPYWTFYGCDRLKELYLPSSIEEVEESALSECPNLNYVSYNGSEVVEEEIERQLAEETVKQPIDIADTKVSYEETEGATIVTKTENETGTSVNATVTNPDGWEDVVDSVLDAVRKDDAPIVNIEVQGDHTLSEGALSDLADREVVVTIHTSENVDWQVVLPDQTAESLSGQQNLSVSISRNTSDKYAKVIGNVLSYIVVMGDTTLNSTVLLPLGREAARQTATLYVIDGKDVRKLSSVIVDDDGKAAFCLAGTEAGEYLVAINVQNIPSEEVLIPQKLAAEYGIEYTYGATLTDAYGNQYVLTGRVNKLGFGIGTLTWIIVGVLAGSMVVVGAIMFIWNKQQKNNFARQYKKKR